MDIIETLRARDFLDLASTIAAKHHVLLAEICSEERGPAHVSRAKHELWFVLKMEHHLSYPAIGRLFGRDHTTVMHGVAMHAARDLAKTTTVRAPSALDVA